MASTFPPPASPEFLPTHDALFPFAAQSVVEGLTNLDRSSNNMLRLFTDARGTYGAADQLYTNMPFNELVEWHVDNGDFGPDGALLYKAGLLYGMDLAQHIARETDLSEDMKFDNVTAFEEASDYLLDTYRGLDDDKDNNWIRQKERELIYTGSDILSLANATLNDGIRSRLHELGTKVNSNVLAQHVGVLDGAIFINAYRAFAQGRIPIRFEVPEVQYIPTFNSKIHIQESVTDLTSVYEFEDLTEMLQITEGESQLGGQIASTIKLDGAEYEGHRRFVQIGPNQFTTAVEIEAARAPRYSTKRLGAFCLMGGVVDSCYVIAGAGLPINYVPLATALGATTWYVTERSRRTAMRNAAANRGVAFTVQ